MVPEADDRSANPEALAGTGATRAVGGASGVTLRAVLIGLGMALLIGVGSAAVCFRYQFQGTEIERSEPTRTFLPLAVLFPFFLLVCVFNPLAKWARRAWALRPTELAVIFAMAVVAVSAPIFLLGFGLSILSAPYYFASHENAWQDVLLPLIRPWSIPSNEAGAMRWFYEGLPEGYPMPWAAWMPGLAWWFMLLGAFYFLCVCLVVVFRKQWTEHERLAFPLMELPQAMIADSDGPNILPGILRSRLFWIGFAIAASIYGWNLVHEFYPVWPMLPAIGRDAINVTVARGFPPIRTYVFYFAAIGLMYFAPTDVLLSVWIFVVMIIVQEGIYSRLGLGMGPTGIFSGSLAATAWQSTGAFIVMVCFSIWIARGHLATVFRQAWRNEPGVDDAEPMSYRTAVWGGLASLIFLVGLLVHLGMDWRALSLFIPFLLVVYIGLTKVVAQVGMYYFVPPMIAEHFSFQLLGSRFLGPQNAIALGYQFSWHGDVQAAFMPHAANATNLMDRIRAQRRWFSVVLLGAAGLAIVAGSAYLIYGGYQVGAYNFGTHVWQGTGANAWAHAVAKVRNPTGPSYARLGFMGFGAVLMTVLTYLRYRFAWWPLHPVGLAVASAWPVRRTLLVLFVTWLTKVIVLRTGGSRLYEQSKPFFYGLILGNMCGLGLPLFLDILLWPTGPGTG